MWRMWRVFPVPSLKSTLQVRIEGSARLEGVFCEPSRERATMRHTPHLGCAGSENMPLRVAIARPCGLVVSGRGVARVARVARFPGTSSESPLALGPGRERGAPGEHRLGSVPWSPASGLSKLVAPPLEVRPVNAKADDLSHPSRPRRGPSWSPRGLWAPQEGNRALLGCRGLPRR